MVAINTKTVLEIENISKSFPGVKALNKVSLTLKEGEVHALIGENGAGKSTLMNIIFGLHTPDEGKILLDGEETRINNPIIAQRMGIGIVPQELNLVPYLTTTENILLGMEPCKVEGYILDRKEMASRAGEILERIGGKIDLETPVKDLSVAQQQIVQIARALAFNARILILDEPTASLTIKETKMLFNIIKNFTRQGGSIFYISHRLEEILEIADRITVLRDGNKVAELEPQKTTKDEMVKYMVGREVKGVKNKGDYNYRGKKVVLEIKGLTRYGEFEDISFKLYKGEILGLCGLVGAGRTELVRCIFGDTRQDAGKIFINGEEVNHKHTWDSINNSIGYVPEERRKQGLFSILNVAENMTMPIIWNFTSRGVIKKREEINAVQEYIDKLNIKTPSYKQLIKNLSGGNQQKVILARWLMAGSKVLLLDEPTRGIDVNAKGEIYQLLRELTTEDISIIFISSEMEEVMDVADRIIIMHEGQLKGEVMATDTSQEEIMNIALS